MNQERPDAQARLRKGRETRDQIANILWIIEKAREFQKNISSALLTTPKPLMRASLVAQMVKRLSAMQETGVQSLGQEDPLEMKMATHSNILAWKIPQREEPGGL